MAEGKLGALSKFKNETSAVEVTPRLPPKFVRQFSNVTVYEAIKDNLIVKSDDELCFRKGECFQILDDSEAHRWLAINQKTQLKGYIHPSYLMRLNSSSDKVTKVNNRATTLF